MLALDQRESLRTMIAGGPRAADASAPTDEDLIAFKVAAARALTPFASGVLLDVPLGLEPARMAGAIASGCGVLVAADRLTQAPGGPVERTAVDADVLASDTIAAVADAYKLLVIWRRSEEAERRATVEAFVAGCRRRGKAALIEGIVRGADDASPADASEHADLVLEAAVELAALGADLYKAEVPTLGRGDDDAIEGHAARLTDALPCPWVVLSNGTAAERFPSATVAACRGGASGFLAGRAIWSDAFASPDVERHLRTISGPRLASLASAVDYVVHGTETQR
jgi:sulfofructosephosphate aldolase